MILDKSKCSSSIIHFFGSRLKYSRFMCVSLVRDEAVESLVRTLAEHLASWGGAPLQCVFDRPKTVALKWRKNGEVTEWNPLFAYATLEMGVGVELCWPYRAQQKGSVENLVGFVKSSFFKVRRFHDEEDLRLQLRAWHEEVNQQRPCRATGVIPAVRWAEKNPRLRPLKVQPEELALRIPVYVGPTGTVLHDGHAYSMPPEAISMPATLYLYGQRVRIVAGRYEAVYPRKFVAHEGSSRAEHRAALVAAVSGKRGQRYLKRSSCWSWGSLRFAISPRLCIVGRGTGTRMSTDCTRSCRVMVRRFCGEPWKPSVRPYLRRCENNTQPRDATGRPRWRSSFLGDPGAIFSGSSPEKPTAAAGAVGKVNIPLRLRDVQVQGESPASWTFPRNGFSTALLSTAGTEP
jgi:hypothetical protein